MTEKRFVDYFDKDHNYIVQDLQNEDEYQVGFVHCDEDVFLELVNKIADENEQLRLQLNNCSDQRNEFHRGARENANRVGKLKKENEQLRKDATTLIYANQDYRHENEQLKKILNELSDMLQFDVENGIRSYPVKLSEYLSNALKELQE